MFKTLLTCAMLSASSDSAGATGSFAGSDSVKSKPGHTLLFLGDSLTYGYALARADAFPSIVEKRLARRDAKWKVVNAGVNGDTTEGGLRRVDALLAEKPDVLFLALGANDALRGMPASLIEANLRAIIEKATERGVRVVLAGISLPPLAPQVNAFNAIWPRIASHYASTGLTLMPFLLENVFLDERYTLPDRLHPNAAGMRIIATNVWKAVEPVVAKVEERAESAERGVISL